MEKPIFRDETGRRWRKIKTFFFICFFTLCTFISISVLNIYQIVDLPFMNNISSYLFYILKRALQFYLIIAIIIGMLRLIILLIFSNKQWSRQYIERRDEKGIKKIKKIKKIKRSKKKLRKIGPSVSVVIPVYNEEVVIEKTVNAILQNIYPIKEILVVDDGSTDRTAEIVKNISSNRRKVQLVKKENGGKASALNVGFRKAIGDIVVTIDADTIFTEDTIFYLVKQFNNPEVAAVSGNCKIGNIRNYLTIWQHIEYVTVFNLEKRAFEELNSIPVVPGSNSAWRKRVVKKISYYDYDTLAEDTDLTLKILNSGHKVVIDDRAVSYEECPETVNDFIKQRYRWSYGILQSLWKHKRNIFKSKNRALKYFTIPFMLFSYFLYLTAPLIDILFIVALFSGAKLIFLFVLLFYLSDILPSIYAFKLERESMKPLAWVFIQRIAYRYLIAYVTWKTVIMAMKGDNVGWNKFDRSGTNQFLS